MFLVGSDFNSIGLTVVKSHSSSVNFFTSGSNCVEEMSTIAPCGRVYPQP